MGRPRKKPENIDDEFMGKNPLMNDVMIPVRRLTKKKIGDNGEIDVEYSLMEVTPFTKVFEIAGYKKLMMDLSVRGKEMLLYLIHYIPSGKDYMWINRKDYMDHNRIKSTHTFLSALQELSDARYIYPHAYLKDVIWINPVLFFKGSRINKYNEQLTIKKYKKNEDD